MLVKRGEGNVPVPVQLGAMDGAYMAMRAETLQPGDAVITGLAASGRAEGGQDSRRLLC